MIEQAFNNDRPTVGFAAFGGPTTAQGVPNQINGILPTQFQEKEKTKRTVFQQVNFNIERLNVLEKEISTLIDMMLPYLTTNPLETPKQAIQVDEQESQIIKLLKHQCDKINDLIYIVELIKRHNQL
jgi:hypothetical protein